MSEHHFRAVIFDLDGVITKTAQVHSRAWKEMFDEYLKYRQEQFGEPFNEFTNDNDYLPYVDGKPRYEGVKAFLQARGIELPFGDPQSNPGHETVCGLGNRKNQKFNEILKRDGVKTYDSTIALIKELKEAGIHVGIASSSKNCAKVIETAGIKDLFETRIDGVVSAELQLKGKPEPDIFATACDNLGVCYDRAVVVEDAVSGVQAGANGNFGLVVGVARENNQKELKSSGADIVVTDLAELDITRLDDWFRNGLKKDQWCINYYDYVTEQEGIRESLCTVGNGYFGTRGASEESAPGDIHYPGTYIAGVYNRLSSRIGGKTLHNEDLVNCPNWLPVQFRIGDGDWIQFTEVEIVDYHRQLDLKHGILRQRIVLGNEKGQRTLIESERLASMADPHVGSLQYRITPLNYSANITVRSGIKYDIRNTGVKRYQQLENKHLKFGGKGSNENLIYVSAETNQSGIKIAEAVKTLFLTGDRKVSAGLSTIDETGGIYSQIQVFLSEGQPLTVEKLVSIYTSRDSGNMDPLAMAKNSALSLESFNWILDESIKVWTSLWQEIDLEIDGDRFAQRLLRFNLYHLLITKSPASNMIDWGYPTRGLHGEAYRGHIFWDELFILPFYSLHLPETVKSILLYRYRRLGKARERARTEGYLGAMFPWQSGSDGREETQTCHLNPISGEWGKDNSYLQRHVTIAIAYNIWTYYWTTFDLDFMAQYGAEMFLEIVRFWASAARINAKTGRYELDSVMGPDEFHEHLPGSSKAGFKNNSYTNIMVVWLLKKGIEILELFTDDVRQLIINNIQLSEAEICHWNEIRHKMTIPFSDEGILAQFDGYFALRELNWDDYKRKYKNITRMDRILKAEGSTPDEYKVSKQADTLMLFYLLPTEELKSICIDLGYHFDNRTLKKNFDYYFPRTSHGSTLSLIVHSTLASTIGRKQLSFDFFLQSLVSDYRDVQGGTTAEGIHSGVMGGSVMHVLRAFAGISFSGEILQINPNLPSLWRSLRFNVLFRNVKYHFNITSKKIEVSIGNNEIESVEIEVMGNLYILQSAEQQLIVLT